MQTSVPLPNRSKRVPPLAKPFPLKWDSHLTSFRKDDFWKLVRECVANLDIPRGLEMQYADASLTIHNKSRQIAVKVTTGGEVQVERKLSKYEFKSQKFVCSSVEESIEQFVVCFTQQFKVPHLS